MKNLIKILKVNKLNLFIISLVYLASCATTHNATVSDDVYYNKKDASSQPQSSVGNKSPFVSNNISNDEYGYANTKNTGTHSDSVKSDESHLQRFTNNNADPANQQPYYSDSSSYRDQNGNNYVTNNYYDYDYAARIRRFQNPDLGFGYYNDYYTNPYWYDWDPYWCFGIGFGWGWGGFGFGWGGYPYYGWGGGYGWGGYPYLRGEHYYNGLGRRYTSAYHYGGRAPITVGALEHKDAPLGSNNTNSMSSGVKYQNPVASGKANNGSISNKSNNSLKNNTTANPQLKKFSNPSVKSNNNLGRQTAQGNMKSAQQNSKSNYPQYSKPNQRYSNSGYSKSSASTQKRYAKPNYSAPKSYTSSGYSQPKSGQYYSNPKYSSSNSRYSSMPGYSRGSRSSNYSAPSRSYSSPNYNRGGGGYSGSHSSGGSGSFGGSHSSGSSGGGGGHHGR